MSRSVAPWRSLLENAKEVKTLQKQAKACGLRWLFLQKLALFEVTGSFWDGS